MKNIYAIFGKGIIPDAFGRPRTAPPAPAPTGLEWELAIMPHVPTKKGYRVKNGEGSVILRAVTPDGERIPHGNIAKILPDGTVYLYHTVNPALNLPLDAEGRLVIIQ